MTIKKVCPKNNFYFILFIVLCFFASSCQQGKPAATIVQRDTTITPANAYSDLFFDSASLENYLQKTPWHDSLKKAMRNFYNGRNYQYAWLNEEGFTEQAFHFQNLLNEYISYSKDSVVFNSFVKQLFDSAQLQKQPLQLADSTIFRAEMGITSSFLRYARRAYQGNIALHQDDLNWFIPRKRIDPLAILDSFTNKRGTVIDEPINRQYQLLKEKLLQYYEMQKQGSFPKILSLSKSYRPGDSSIAITALKKRLHAAGDYLQKDTSPIFSNELKEAVMQFQKRYGLKQDGVVGETTLSYLNETPESRIRQILVNMERMRWIPAQPEKDFILVNIPQYRLTVFEKGKPSFGMDIVVGTSQNRTVIFTGNLKYVVFAPYWNVPPGILKNEVLPAIQRNPNYLENNHMEWHNNTVRQKPGPWNALGRVKFLFPNSYNIYLHDTPAKSLFDRNKRAFSHGCIRVAEPKKLAEWILRKQSSWTAERMEKAMDGLKEQWVTVSEPIPVFIGYFTAWVDSDGLINFRDDIYGHDKKLAGHLFTGE